MPGLFDLDQKIAVIDSEREKLLKRANALCLREDFDKALEIYESILDEDPECVAAYIGVVRVRSEDYTKVDAPEVEKAIRIANKFLPDDFEDEEYLAFLKKRKRVLNEKEEAKALELQRKEETAKKQNGPMYFGAFRFEKNGPNSVRLAKLLDQSLSKVVIPSKDEDGNPVTEIGYCAFERCKSLKSVSIPNGVISIGGSAFYGCSNLAEIEIPESMTDIGNFAFAHCWNLPHLILPDDITDIGESAFYCCANLTEVSLPSGLTEVKNGLFSLCTKLQTVTIPETVNWIGKDVFFCCESLVVRVPKDLNADASAFKGCKEVVRY